MRFVNNKTMYKELEKYKTGKKITQKDFDFYLKIGEEIIELDRYDFKLGDIIHDFTKHVNKSRWRRKSNHKHLTKIYLDILNKITLTHGF